jgi:enoyl-CoA hydratase/carnithine racemase
MSDVVSWHTHSPGVWVVTIERPPANALGLPLLDGLTEAMEAATAAGDVKVMVISSAVQGFFAAGADIKHLATIDRDSFSVYGAQMRSVFDRLAASPWLSVAAVDGLALGGGMELTLACTMRVAGPGSRFGLPEVKLGLLPGSGGTQRLPRIVGRGRALDLMLTARQMKADEAAAIGLVDRLVDGDPLEAALELAAELAAMSLPAQLAVVRCADASFEMPLAEGGVFEAEEILGLFENGEAAEGISAFIAKRPPSFA